MEITSYDILSSNFKHSAVVHDPQYNKDWMVVINMGALIILRKQWNSM